MSSSSTNARLGEQISCGVVLLLCILDLHLVRKEPLLLLCLTNAHELHNREFVESLFH